MKKNQITNQIYSKGQLTTLVILRILIGWHLLYEGFAKVFNPYWSAGGYLSEAKWIFSGFFHWIADNSTILMFVDFINEWGLIIIGLCLVAGCFTQIATIAGVVLLSLYYLAAPPLIGLAYSMPNEGSYLIVNKTLIELFALIVLAYFPTGKIIGLDVLISKKRSAN